MSKHITSLQRAYLAGFLDGDGSIYVRMKPNSTYKYSFQISPSIILFQSKKTLKLFQKMCSIIPVGYLRERKDGILEYTISRQEDIVLFLSLLQPYLMLKREHAELMLTILTKKRQVKNKKDFIHLAALIEKFREINYSKKRKRHSLTP